MNTQQQMIDVLNDLDRLIEQHKNGCPYISERVYLAMCSQADYLAGQIRLMETEKKTKGTKNEKEN